MSDTIYREDAIEIIKNWFEVIELNPDILIDSIETLPSADRPQGEWILDPNGMDWNIPAWRCSRCGFVANYIGTEANGLGRNPMNWAGSNYCPNCGARMKGADDEHNK